MARLTPEEAGAWVSVGRDVLIALVAASICIWQGILSGEPNPTAIGLGGTLFGLPMAFRLDQWRRRNQKAASAQAEEKP